MLNIAINMGVAVKNKKGKYLPLIGEVLLNYKLPISKENLNTVFEKLDSANDIKFVIWMLEKLNPFKDNFQD